MSKSDPLVSEVSRLASEGQPNSYDRAYQALQNGFDKFLDNERQCSPDHTIDQAKADKYWSDINGELQQRGFLPGLSVAYLKANFDRLDTQGRKTGNPAGPDGMLTHSEIRQEDGRNKIFARQFDEQMGRKDFFHEVARKSDNGNTRKVIEHEDIDKYLRQQDKTNVRHEKQEEARQSMEPLFEENGCENKPLLEYLNSRSVNGRVTVNEMERFLSECDRRQGSQDAVFNDKNRAYVESILNGDMGWNKAGDGFNINKLARKAGFDALNMKEFNSAEQLKANYNAANEVFEEKTAPNKTEITPKTKCEEIEEETNKKNEKTEKTEKLGCIEVPDSVFTVRQGEGYWHVAKRLLSLNPQDKPTNQEIMHCMTALMTQNSAALNKEQRHGYAPMLRPGDKVHCDINALCAQVPAAKRILRR